MMRNLGYIRLATYVIIILAFLGVTKPKRHAIEVKVESELDATARMLAEEQSLYSAYEDELIRRQEKADFTRTPGFESTRLSGREVMRIATECATVDGDDLDQYRKPIITLHRRDDRLTWLVDWTAKGTGFPGGFFAVSVDDETGKAELHPGM